MKYINKHGDWGLGIGDWGLGIGPNPQYPIPKIQYILFKIFSLKIFKIKKYYLKLKNEGILQR